MESGLFWGVTCCLECLNECAFLQGRHLISPKNVQVFFTALLFLQTIYSLFLFFNIFKTGDGFSYDMERKPMKSIL